MSLNKEKKPLADRRLFADRRKSSPDINTHAFERRIDIQRRLLNLDALSVDEWLADHQTKRGLSHQVDIVSQ